MPKRKADAPVDPDKLVRQAAGSYRTADDRFEVREAAGEWFLVDTQQSNEFGQELMRGPFETLKAVRAEIPRARETEPAAPSRRPRQPAKKPAKREPTAKPKAPPPPPSWIDQLPRNEAARLRRAIRALEEAGVPDAETIVRRDRDGLFPLIATRLIEGRLDSMIEELPAKDRKRARDVADRVIEILSVEGAKVADPLPGWTLVEVGPEPEPPNRRIDLRR